jgi:hypothetical protein
VVARWNEDVGGYVREREHRDRGSQPHKARQSGPAPLRDRR